jgi:hypothetical protein
MNQEIPNNGYKDADGEAAEQYVANHCVKPADV